MLIFIRRFLAVLLIPVFFVLFAGTLLTFRVNSTLLEPEFYTSTLDELDAYNFLYDTGIPTAIEEAEKRAEEGEGGFDLDDLPLNLDLTPERISANIKEVFPPPWLEQNVVTVINEAVPYVTGETDEFVVTIPVDDRADSAERVAERLILDADIYAFLLEDVVPREVAKNSKTLNEDLPFGLTLSNAEIIDAVQRVVPEDWLKERLAEVIDEALPYFTGRSDTFSVLIPLQGRADIGLVVLEEWLLTSLDGGAYDYLLERQIAPVVTVALASSAELPFGVRISSEEVVEAIGKVLPQEWVEDRVREAVDTVGPYLAGRIDTFTLVLPLEDRLDLAAETLVDTADAKLEQAFLSLRTCTLAETLDLELSLDELPPCRPPGVTYELVKGIIGLDVLQQLGDKVFAPLPRSIELTERNLFSAIGPDSTVQVEDLRSVLRDGYTFDEQDLIALIRRQADTPQDAEDVIAVLEDVRRYMREGFTFDETEVEEQFDNPSDFATFNDVRGFVDTGLTWLFPLIVLLAVVALVIGLLGGRSWGTRLAWAGVPLLISGVITAVVLGPVSSFGFEAVDELIRDIDVNEVFIEKALELRRELECSFVSPIAFQSAIVGALGAAMMIGGILLSRRRRYALTTAPAPASPWETEAARRTREQVEGLRADLGDEPASDADRRPGDEEEKRS